MALVTVTDTGQVFRSPEEVSTFLAQHGIWYRRFEDLEKLDPRTDEQGILVFTISGARKRRRRFTRSNSMTWSKTFFSKFWLSSSNFLFTFMCP